MKDVFISLSLKKNKKNKTVILQVLLSHIPYSARAIFLEPVSGKIFNLGYLSFRICKEMSSVMLYSHFLRGGCDFYKPFL